MNLEDALRYGHLEVTSLTLHPIDFIKQSLYNTIYDRKTRRIMMFPPLSNPNLISLEEMNEKLGFDYQIEYLEMYKEFNGKQDVIFCIRGYIVSFDKNDNGKSFRRYFAASIPTDDLTNFTNYKELTKEQVHAWIEKDFSESARTNIKRELYEEHFPTKRIVRPNF